MKKLFLCGRAGLDEPGCWAKMMGEKEARDMVSESLAAAGVSPETPVSSFSVERHPGDGEDSRFYRWGLEEAGFEGDGVLENAGLRVEVDGKVLLDTTVEDDEEDASPEDGAPVKDEGLHAHLVLRVNSLADLTNEEAQALLREIVDDVRAGYREGSSEEIGDMVLDTLRNAGIPVEGGE